MAEKRNKGENSQPSPLDEEDLQKVVPRRVEMIPVVAPWPEER